MKIQLVFLIINIVSFYSFGQTTKDPVSLDVMVGQMIMTGIGDESIMNKENFLIKEIKSGKAGGVIYFEKNVNPENPKKELIKSIKILQSIANIPLLVSIDEEGGLVNRLKPKYGFPKTAEAGYLGQINDKDSTRYYATNTASTLAELGFNVNFAPDVDVNINPENPVIGGKGRSYSGDPNIVAVHASEVVKVHREYGIFTALKHFPGHGSSQNDSHYGVADVTNYWQFSELMPYKNMLDSGMVDCVMTAHIVNKHLDPSGYPATLSPYVVSNILRNVLGFDGVVFSDDMQMHAISRNFGFEESIKLAINAGVDVLVFANNVPGNERRTPSQIHGIIMDYISKGEISEETIRESYNRIMKLKSQLP